MQIDPFAEWRRLSELYREKSDEELLELAANIADLTEVAQQVLRDEMKKRGLNEPRGADDAAKSPIPAFVSGLEPDDDSPTAETWILESDEPHEFTWKTLLCECETGEEAGQLRLALKEGGIDSWIEGPRSLFSRDMHNPRVLVAADQLDQAREIASRPIPQAIVELSEAEVPEFEPPVCPGCGAADPVLEGVDPVNTWLCESCGKQWTDPVADV